MDIKKKVNSTDLKSERGTEILNIEFTKRHQQKKIVDKRYFMVGKTDPPKKKTPPHQADAGEVCGTSPEMSTEKLGEYSVIEMRSFNGRQFVGKDAYDNLSKRHRIIKDTAKSQYRRALTKDQIILKMIRNSEIRENAHAIQLKKLKSEMARLKQKNCRLKRQYIIGIIALILFSVFAIF